MWSAPVGGYLADRFGRKRVIAVVAVLSAAGVTALPHLPYGFGYGALVLLLGALLFSRMPGAEAHIIGLTPPRFRSTVLGIYYFAGMEGSGILSPIIGIIVDTRGFPAAFHAVGIGLGILSVLCIVLLFAMEKTRPLVQTPRE
jgi:MFS family permease